MMIYINGSIEGLSDVEIGEDYIKHSQGMMEGVHFENIIFTDDSDGQEIKDVKIKFVRAKRTELLEQTDYLVLADYPIDSATLELWKVYRQALRDMPATVDLDNIVWPVSPNEQQVPIIPTEPI